MTNEEYLARVEESQQEILRQVFFQDSRKPIRQVSGQLFLVGESLIRQLEERINEQPN